MKTLHIIVILIFICACSKKRDTNDCFYMNLKGEIDSLNEYTQFSFEDISNPKNKVLDKHLITLLEIQKYVFDSLGYIEKEYTKSFFDSTANWYSTKDSNTVEKNYKDSIIITSYQGKPMKIRKKHIFDKNGLLTQIIYSLPDIDTTRYERNSNGNILREYHHSFGIDDEMKINKEYKLNSKGDVITENVNKRFRYAGVDTISKEVYTLEYDYCYDSMNNWILRIMKNKDRVIEITQRQIHYR